MRGVLDGGGGGLLRLGGDERGCDADDHERRHGEIARAPGGVFAEAEAFKAAHQKQRARGGGQHADPVRGHIGGHAGGLLALVETFDAEGVDDDVLRGGRGGDQQRANATTHQGAARIAEREEDDRRDQQKLGEHEPASPSPEQPRQHRHVERIDHRRPQELDGVGRADQREQADGAEIDAGFAHPHRQRRARQRQRQPGREAEEQHDQHARLEIDRERVNETRPGRCGLRRRGHRCSHD